VLLLGFSTIYYIVAVRERVKIEAILYPEDIVPVANFVTDCIKQAGKEGLILAGQQAGYVTIPRDIENEFTSYLRLDSLGLRKVPYWYYINQKRIPPLAYIQSQLNQYVTEKTLNCINEFKDLEEKYIVTINDALVTKTTITKNDVVFEVTYPIIAQPKAGKATPMELFVADVPIRFKKAYDIAKSVMESEIENLWFENLTLNLMAGNEDIPMDGFDLDCSPKIWPLTQVQDLVSRVLAVHIARARVKNTAYPPFIEEEKVYKDLQKTRKKIHKTLAASKTDLTLEQTGLIPDYTPEDAWEYSHSFWDMGVDNTDMKVSFQYIPQYGLDLRPTPDPGPLLTSKPIDGSMQFLSFICINIFHYVWDVQYPIKASVYDPQSLEGQGFYFDFAFPVTIDNNRPIKDAVNTYTWPEQGSEAQEFCGAMGQQWYDIRAKGYVQEDLPPEELEGVTILYKCGDKRCTLGKTKADGGYYRLFTPLPEACVNPFVYAELPGYIGGRTVVKNPNVDIELTKLRNMSINIVKWPYFLVDKTLGNTPVEAFNDDVMIFIKAHDMEYDTFGIWTKDEDNYMQMIDDKMTYDVKVMLMQNDQLVGGYQNSNWSVSFNEIAGSNTITFNLIEFRPIPKELNFEIASYLFGETYKDDLAPELS